jgi:hypothetical protein
MARLDMFLFVIHLAVLGADAQVEVKRHTIWSCNTSKFEHTETLQELAVTPRDCAGTCQALESMMHYNLVSSAPLSSSSVGMASPSLNSLAALRVSPTLLQEASLRAGSLAQVQNASYRLQRITASYTNGRWFHYHWAEEPFHTELQPSHSKHPLATPIGILLEIVLETSVSSHDIGSLLDDGSTSPPHSSPLSSPLSNIIQYVSSAIGGPNLLGRVIGQDIPEPIIEQLDANTLKLTVIQSSPLGPSPPLCAADLTQIIQHMAPVAHERLHTQGEALYTAKQQLVRARWSRVTANIHFPSNNKMESSLQLQYLRPLPIPVAYEPIPAPPVYVHLLRSLSQLSLGTASIRLTIEFSPQHAVTAISIRDALPQGCRQTAGVVKGADGAQVHNVSWDSIGNNISMNFVLNAQARQTAAVVHIVYSTVCVLVSAESFPPDAHRGMTVPAGVVTIGNRHFFSQPLLFELHSPDFSMPFNVITLIGTSAAFILGSFINTLARKRVPEKT